MEVGQQRELATPLLLSTGTTEDSMPSADSLTQRSTMASGEAGSPTKTSTSNSSHHHLNALEIDASSINPELSGNNGINNGTEDDLPLDPHAMDSGGGDLPSAVLGTIKAMVGPAILYLPHGFVAAGYLVALPIMIAATVLYLHSSKCLLEVWKYESEKQLLPQFEEEEEEELSLQVTEPGTESPNSRTKLPPRVAAPVSRRSLSYPDLAYRAFGTRGETMVKVGIALMQSVRKL